MCPKVAEHAAAGHWVYDIHRKIIVAGSEWNIDLVLGPPPTGLARAVTGKGIHRNVRALVQETMALLRSLPQRSARGEGPGLEATGAIVVSHDNINNDRTELILTPPAPQIGDPLHYDSFLRRICDSYTQRW